MKKRQSTPRAKLRRPAFGHHRSGHCFGSNVRHHGRMRVHVRRGRVSLMGAKRRPTDPAPRRTAQPEEIDIALCDARCDKCKYGGTAFKSTIICEYLDLNHKRHRRPCPAGKGCTVFEPRKGPKNSKTPPIWQNLHHEEDDQ